MDPEVWWAMTTVWSPDWITVSWGPGDRILLDEVAGSRVVGSSMFGLSVAWSSLTTRLRLLGQFVLSRDRARYDPSCARRR